VLRLRQAGAADAFAVTLAACVELTHTYTELLRYVRSHWLRWQSAVASLYHQRVTLPVRFWVACGRPPQFRPQLPWWHSFVWRYLVITGMRRSRVARPPVEQRGPEHYPGRFMQ